MSVITIKIGNKKMIKKKIKIGLTCVPCKVIDKQELEAEEILVSYGGGMGGANVKYYASWRDDLTDDDDFCSITTLTGKVITIGKKWIVSFEDIKLQMVKYDCTEQRNSQKNRACKSCIETYYYIIRADEVAEITTDYIGIDKPAYAYKETETK